MNELVPLEILVNRETLSWLEEEAQHLAAHQRFAQAGAIGPADVVSLIVERTRAHMDPINGANYIESLGNHHVHTVVAQESDQQETLERPAADEGGYTGPSSTQH